MNPYEASNGTRSELLGSRRYFLTGFVSAMLGFVSGIPGMLYLYSAVPTWFGSGRRYATYDQEFFLGGILVDSGVAKVLSIIFAPLFIFLAIHLSFRGWKRQRQNRQLE